MKTDFCVMWDNSNGIDWDESFDNLRRAIKFYNNLPASVPYKKLLMTDRDGDHDLLDSKGTDNLSRYFCLNDYR